VRMHLLSAVVLAVSWSAALAGELPANQWTPQGSATFPLPKDSNYPSLIGCKLVWGPSEKEAVVLPGFDIVQADYWSFPLEKGAWERLKGKVPKDLTPNRGTDPQAYCYMPGLKKVLVLKGKWGGKTAVSSWLFDPADGSWQNLPDVVAMSDRSADFNPVPGKDGCTTPLWGQLVYDAHNKEAVLCGGGCTWGRVEREKSVVGPGDWIYDESAEPKRCRRLTDDDKGKVTSARRWFPAHCGTWTFSEESKKWTAIEQPLGQQPSGRILPGMACDAAEKKIVLFGGDDLARCFDDTWLYDCASRRWEKLDLPVRPAPRAGHAMVYDPEGKVVLLVGGYTGGWKALKDVWAFSTKEKKWTRLGLDLAAPAFYASAEYLPSMKAIAAGFYGRGSGNGGIAVNLLRLEVGSAPKAQPEAVNPKSAYHCKNKGGPTDLPGEWLTGKGEPEKKETVLAGLKGLAANSWKNMNPPKLAPERNWGSYVYDTKTHRGFAWGGGHSAYAGAEMSTYDLTVNRWDGMADPTNYNPIWLHGMVGGPPGVSFGGWSLLLSHARKSYGVDPRSDTVVNYVGDVFSIKHRMFTANIGMCPGKYSYSDQVAFATAPHGLYAYSPGLLARADVKAGRWEEIAKGGPPRHDEHSFLAYDSKRDRLVYFYPDARVWVFDFAAKAWSEEKPEGKAPPAAYGDATYVPGMDAVLMVFATGKEGPEKLWFYKCAEKKWYSAPSEGDKFAGVHAGPRDWSPHWDPELGVVVRITPTGFAAWLNVHVMRLDPASLKLSPVE